MVELVVMAGESVESSKLVDDDDAAVEDAWAVGMAAWGSGVPLDVGETADDKDVWVLGLAELAFFLVTRTGVTVALVMVIAANKNRDNTTQTGCFLPLLVWKVWLQFPLCCTAWPSADWPLKVLSASELSSWAAADICSDDKDGIV